MTVSRTLIVAAGFLCAGVVACRPPTYIPPDVRALVASSIALDVAWRVPLGTQEYFGSDPVERAGVALSSDGRTLIAAVAAGDLVAIDTTTGEVQWQLDLGTEPFASAPSVHGEHVFVGAPDGTFRAYHAGSGGLEWSTDLGRVFNAAPAVDDELVVIATADGGLIALSRDDGRQQWEHTRRSPAQLSIAGGPTPRLWGDTILVGFPDGVVGAYDREGTELWLTNIASGEDRLTDVDTTPLVADDGVYAASFSGGLHRLDRETGDIVWRTEITGATSPVAVGDALVTTTASGSVFWIDPETGAITAELGLDDDAAGPITRSGEFLLVSEPHDGLYVLAASRPWIHARFQPDSGFSSNAVAGSERIYALSDAGVVYGIRMVPVGN